MKPLIASIVLFLLCALGADAQVVWTYTAHYNGQSVPLDSVVVENLTRGCYVVTYDTFLVVPQVGIEEHMRGSGALTLGPGRPNPFGERTTLSVTLASSGELVLDVFDAQGQRVAGHQGVFPPGEHAFELSGGESGPYLVRATALGERRTVRVVALPGGSGAPPSVRYVGHGVPGAGPKLSFCEWQAGDQVRHTGYVTLRCEVMESHGQITNVPTEGTTNYDFAIQPPLNPTACLETAPADLNFGSICVNGTAGPFFFQLRGANLACDGTLSVPATSGFGFSETEGGSYTSGLTLPVISGNITDTVWVRFTPTMAGTYSPSVVIACGGVQATVSLQGVAVEHADAGSDSTLTVCSNGEATDLFAQLGGTPQTGGSWTFNGNAHGASYDPISDDPGTYTYTVTAPSQCGSDSATVTVTETAPPATPMISGPSSFCADSSITLTSSSTTGNSWSTGAITPNITVTTAGYYTVTVTANGCSATSTLFAVSSTPLPPMPTIDGPSFLCNGSVATLSSSSLTDNLWSPDSLTASDIQISFSAVYTVTVTVSGCSATSAPFFVDDQVYDVDGNGYGTKQIGNQCWTSENLRTGHYSSDVSVIPEVADGVLWSGLSTGAWCNFENNSANDINYGKLYNWYAVSDPRNVCPAGWHVSSDSEWQDLEIFLGMPSAEAITAASDRGSLENIGGQLKATWLWSAPNSGANNSSGFTAYPGGGRDVNGIFVFQGNGRWWNSGWDDNYAWDRGLNHDQTGVDRSLKLKKDGYSVRCIKD